MRNPPTGNRTSCPIRCSIRAAIRWSCKQAARSTPRNPRSQDHSPSGGARRSKRTHGAGPGTKWRSHRSQRRRITHNTNRIRRRHPRTWGPTSRYDLTRDVCHTQGRRMGTSGASSAGTGRQYTAIHTWPNRMLVCKQGLRARIWWASRVWNNTSPKSPTRAGLGGA